MISLKFFEKVSNRLAGKDIDIDIGKLTWIIINTDYRAVAKDSDGNYNDEVYVNHIVKQYFNE